MSTPTPTLTGAYTCTHRSDQMRAACPVCLVASLTAERDRLRAELEKVYVLVTPVGFDLPGGIFETAQAVTALTAERDQLRAHVSKAILTTEGTMLCSPQVAVKYNEAIARAERAEAAAKGWEADSLLRAGNEAYWRARAEKAEAEAERYRLVTLRQDAELAAERARLDSGQILLTVAGERVWHSGVDLRDAIDAAMKEDAK